MPDVCLCWRSFREGPVDRIRGVLVRAQKNYFGSVDSKKSYPARILAQGSRGLHHPAGLTRVLL
jgi:hypothetical protein